MTRHIHIVTAMLALTLALILSGAAGWLGVGVALNRLQARGESDLALSGDRLSGHLSRYRETVVLMAAHPDLQAMLRGDAAPEPIFELLQEIGDKTGAAGLQLVARNRAPLAAAGSIPAPDRIAPAITRALHGALGSYHLVRPDGTRQFIYAAPVFDGAGAAAGALLIAIDAATIEWNWPSDPNAVYFSDASGVIFVSNRSDLILQRISGGAPGAFPGFRRRAIRGHDIWRLDAEPYLPRNALHLTRPMPVVGLNAGILIDAGPAIRAGLWQAAGTFGLCLAIGMIILQVAERRRTLIDRLGREAAAKHVLEARVRERTAELSAANAGLRREVAERHEAEAALRRAQEDLVQAGKLSALGKMSAGISHELNQPLMAIRTFAENAEAFLARDKPQVAADNLTRISELARRMGRIITNLRAFARQESEALIDVDLVAVLQAVLELTAGRIAEDGVDLVWTPPEGPVLVRGGEVRLQQVAMNLVSNALDAMAGQDDRRLEIAITRANGRVRLAVSDTGPGISEPGKIFDPFYSTKAVGSANGMGLGLSISYGLVQSFGGDIRGQNRDAGGAVFTVDLVEAGREAAA